MANRERKDRLSDDKYCFACGTLNPIGLRMEVAYREGKAISRLAVKKEFQGWKNIVHGGVVATILDEIMAHAVTHYAGKAVTTTLQITYRVPMHVGEEIQAEGYIVQRKSRGALAKGEIRRADSQKILATAESRLVFIQ